MPRSFERSCRGISTGDVVFRGGSDRLSSGVAYCSGDERTWHSHDAYSLGRVRGIPGAIRSTTDRSHRSRRRASGWPLCRIFVRGGSPPDAGRRLSEAIAAQGISAFTGANRVNATLGFRVKSGWAAAVLLAGPVESPQLLDRRVVQLCDPAIPE